MFARRPWADCLVFQAPLVIGGLAKPTWEELAHPVLGLRLCSLEQVTLWVLVSSSVKWGRRTPSGLNEDLQAPSGFVKKKKNHRTWDPRMSEGEAQKSRPFVIEMSDAQRGEVTYPRSHRQQQSRGWNPVLEPEPRRSLPCLQERGHS